MLEGGWQAGRDYGVSDQVIWIDGINLAKRISTLIPAGLLLLLWRRGRRPPPRWFRPNSAWNRRAPISVSRSANCSPTCMGFTWRPTSPPARWRRSSTRSISPRKASSSPSCAMRPAKSPSSKWWMRRPRCSARGAPNRVVCAGRAAGRVGGGGGGSAPARPGGGGGGRAGGARAQIHLLLLEREEQKKKRA